MYHIESKNDQTKLICTNATDINIIHSYPPSEPEKLYPHWVQYNHVPTLVWGQSSDDYHCRFMAYYHPQKGWIMRENFSNIVLRIVIDDDYTLVWLPSESKPDLFLSGYGKVSFNTLLPQDKQTSYHFFVENPDDVDVARIIAENPEAEAILVANGLFLKECFLNKFDYGDDFKVCGVYNSYRLCSGWGYPAFKVEQSGKNEVRVHAYSDKDMGESIPGWRVYPIYSSVEYPMEDLVTLIKAQLDKARKYTRRLKVNVEVL